MADRTLIQGAKDVYGAGMYDPAKNERTKGRMMRAAENVGRSMERKYYDDQRRQENEAKEQRALELQISEGKYNSAKLSSQITENMDESTLGLLGPHVLDLKKQWDEANTNRLKDPTGGHEKTMADIERKLQNLQKTGATVTARNKLDDGWMDSISNADSGDKSIITAAIASGLQIDKNGNGYYDMSNVNKSVKEAISRTKYGVDVDGDGVVDRVNEATIGNIIAKGLDEKNRVAGNKLGDYIATTAFNAKHNNRYPGSVSTDIKNIIKNQSGNNETREYKDWRVVAYDFDPELNDDVNMTYSGSQDWQDKQNDWLIQWGEEKGYNVDEIVDPSIGKISLDDFNAGKGKSVVLTNEKGDIMNSEAGNWMDDNEFAFGNDKKLKTSVTKWLDTGLSVQLDAEKARHEEIARLKAGEGSGSKFSKLQWKIKNCFLDHN